jgi:high-affinity nickel-transport protein
MLILAGGALALFRAQLPDPVSDAFELVVAVALVALGVRGLVQAARAGREGPAVMHRHGDVAHVHAGPGDHLHVNRFTLARLPFAIGLLHGLAGSGALAALVVARMPSPVFGLSFIAVYAIGAALGMTALAGLLGVPLARFAKSRRAMTFVVAASALVSLVVGVAWAAPIVARFV